MQIFDARLSHQRLTQIATKAQAKLAWPWLWPGKPDIVHIPDQSSMQPVSLSGEGLRVQGKLKRATQHYILEYATLYYNLL